MVLPQYADLRKEMPWLPESWHLYAIRDYKMVDGKAIITLQLELEPSKELMPKDVL